MKKIILASFIFLLSSLDGQTIAEKKAGITGAVGELSPEMQKFLVDLNTNLKQKQEDLQRLQTQVMELYLSGATPEDYQNLLVKINDTKENIRILQESWREMVTQQGIRDEGYALWHQPETTLEQLVLDYGSLDYVYLIPPEIAAIQVSVNSNIPIPRAAWGEMLEQILMQNSVGIKTLNPYLRQLYPLKDDFSTMRLITNDRDDLAAYPSNTRVSFVLAPEPEDVQRVWYFLGKFINPNTTVLERIGRVILIVGDVAAVKDLLKIYDFVAANKEELDYKAIPLFRVDAEEMAKILQAIFQQFEEEAQVQTIETVKKDDKNQTPTRKPYTPTRSRSKSGGAGNALEVIALPKIARAVFLVGTRDEIEKAEEIIKEVENQVGEARQKEIFWYKVKHSDPEELAEVLAKIYNLMLVEQVGYPEEEQERARAEEEKARTELQRSIADDIQKIAQQAQEPRVVEVSRPSPLVQDSFYQQGGYVINPRPAEPGTPEKREVNQGRDNFIVDLKSNSLVMVVESDLVPKLKEILQKLDVPKKMVQIEVLAYESRSERNTNYGLNLLKIGTKATNTHNNTLCWNDIASVNEDGTLASTADTGILSLIWSRTKSSCGIPAFDFVYRFLMTQQDGHINASPSVVTMNQTPANIVINEEISLNTGILQVETTGGTQLQNTFVRAQYGINITVTPTIHLADPDDPLGDQTDYVTLVSDITFDTFVPGTEASQQPDVVRRHITNEVRVPDGQTVIIGGLRRKDSSDFKERIPFFGELPGLGKLFSETSITDRGSELFIFITAKIIKDPVEDFDRLRAQELCKRPGDLPCFMSHMHDAFECEKRRLMQGSMHILFGTPRPRYICEEGEWDGR